MNSYPFLDYFIEIDDIFVMRRRIESIFDFLSLNCHRLKRMVLIKCEQQDNRSILAMQRSRKTNIEFLSLHRFARGERQRRQEKKKLTDACHSVCLDSEIRSTHCQSNREHMPPLVFYSISFVCFNLNTLQTDLQFIRDHNHQDEKKSILLRTCSSIRRKEKKKKNNLHFVLMDSSSDDCASIFRLFYQKYL